MGAPPSILEAFVTITMHLWRQRDLDITRQGSALDSTHHSLSEVSTPWSLPGERALNGVEWIDSDELPPPFAEYCSDMVASLCLLE